MGSNYVIQALLDTPNRTIPSNPLGHGVDVRDVARAHILSLSAPPRPDKAHKRLIVNAKTYTWTELIKIVKEKYPGYEKRLPSSEADNGPQMNVTLDDSFMKKSLDFGDYIPFEKTVEDSFATVIEWERRIKGVSVIA